MGHGRGSKTRILSPPMLNSQLIRSLVLAGSDDGFGIAGAVEEARESLAGLAPRKKRIRCVVREWAIIAQPGWETIGYSSALK